ncbi:hypothetical protein HGRIS_010681 [Hohenbuehelia grisea]|uniref:F-box domain-containing protein n=1 Tax=Hohenbuehelia grisea TaxID=104357 RepID=A0ABR3IXQ8_9AGAR
MAFLPTPSLRRRPSHPLTISPQQNPSTPPAAPWGTTWDVKEDWEATPRLKTASASPRRLIRKVSNIFSARNKSTTNKPPSHIRHSPVSYTALPRSAVPPSPLPSTHSSNESLDDIRQPNGLGKLHTGSLLSVSSSFAHSGDGGDSVNGRSDAPSQYERIRSVSSPNLLLSPAVAGLRGNALRNVMSRNKRLPRSLPRLPQELLNTVVALQPRSSLPSLAIVSQAFCEAARAALYSHLDMRGIRPARLESLNALLALRPDLAGLVECLVLHVWPASFCRDDPARATILCRSTQLFARALQKMIRLRNITLPSFDLALMRDFAPLSIKIVTFLDFFLPPEEESRLKSWLHVQRGIVSLSFPTLSDNHDTLPSSYTQSLNTSPSGSPLPTPLGLDFPMPPSPSTSLSLPATTAVTSKFQLPNLEKLSAPPNLIIALLSTPEPASTTPRSTYSFPPSPGLARSHTSPTLPSIFAVPLEPIIRPIRHTTIHVRSSLYTGLRPSAIMQALSSRGTRHLTLRFGDEVDLRTIEKLLTTTGVKLGRTPSSPLSDANGHSTVSLRVLELVIPVALSDSDTIFRTVSTSLPRFQALQTLRLTSQIPTFHLGLQNTFRASPIEMTDLERGYVGPWTKSCPTLRTIVFPSGAVWRNFRV